MVFMKDRVDVARFNIILLFFFLIGVVGAADSSTDTKFNIRGCTFDFEGSPIGVSAGECSGGVAPGHFFCESDTTPWVTAIEGRGCSLGLSSYLPGDDFCCSSGMFCNNTAPNLFRCDRRLENCVDQGDELACENIGCIWMEIDNECSDNPRSYDCGYYDTSVSCLFDEWNIGGAGVGTEVCGSEVICDGRAFSVPEAGCGCEWYPSAPVGQQCQLKMNITQRYYNVTPDRFECSNIYTLGDCIDGVQNVSWFSNSSILSGFDSGVIPGDCLVALNCNSGESTRFCGEPIIKLPGFSLLSLISSLFIIGLYCFVVRKV